MLRNFNMVCILSDVNKIDPNLTFRSSRTPSVCQYKHQSLVFIDLVLFAMREVFYSVGVIECFRLWSVWENGTMAQTCAVNLINYPEFVTIQEIWYIQSCVKIQ